MRDQAADLRRLVAQKEPSSRIIAVTSGKGGVGKTNLAVNLALALCQMDYRVVLIDVDLGLANVDIVLGITLKYNLGHVINGEKTLRDIIVEGPLGLKIISGGSGITELANLNGYRLEAFVASFEQLNQEFDFVILDTGAGVHRSVISFVLAATDVIVVTTPEPTAITDAYGLLKIIHQRAPHSRVRLVVNMAKSPAEAEMVAARLNSVLREFVQWEVDYTGYILTESQVARAIAEQQPFLLSFPSSMASRSVKRIAGVLAGESAPSQPLGIRGFFARVSGLLHF